MKPKFQENIQWRSTKILQKCSSMPSFKDTNHSSSPSYKSIDSYDDLYRKYVIKWIFSFNKKVTRDTQYLAISYLNLLNKKLLSVNEQNYEKVGLTLLLLASKMNQIYPPKISSMISRCKQVITKEEIIEFQGKILNALDFELAICNNVYTFIHKILGCLYGEKLDQCQKLLRMVCPQRQIYQFGQQILAYAIIYLIVPEFIRKMKLPQSAKMKTLAIKIYNLYTDIKQKYKQQKQNRHS